MQEQNTVAQLYSDVSAIQRVQGLELIEEAQPKPGQTVMDLGCGTGDLTAELARKVGPVGHVFAIDPDTERLSVARQTNAGEFGNITYIEANAEDLSMIDDESIDLFYSNYVIHWLKDKSLLMRGLERCLKPGGDLAVEFCSDLSPFMLEVSKMDAECERVLLPRMARFDEDQCRDVLMQNNFSVEKGRTHELWGHFDRLEDFLDWWKATTHGMFRPEVIEEDDRKALEAHFQGGGDVLINHAVRMFASKPH